MRNLHALTFSLSLTVCSTVSAVQAPSGDRLQAQDALMQDLNSNFGCHLRRYDQGEQLTFGRELTRPECDTLREADAARAAEDLKALSAVALPDEAQELLLEAQSFSVLAPRILDVRRLQDELFRRQVIEKTDRGVRAHYVGDPLESDDRSVWLAAYVQAVQRLDSRWSELMKTSEPECLQPVCDPEIYRVAAAVTLRPPLDWAFLRKGDHIVPPNPYALSFFSQRYGGNDELWAALGLKPDADWMWNNLFISALRAEDGALVFQDVLPESGVRLSVAGWDSRTEYPYVVPLFLLFQQGQDVMSQIAQFPQRALVAQVHEVRFGPYTDVGMISFSHTGAGLRLNLNVLHPPAELGGVEAMRARLAARLTEAFQKAEITN
jgi:hypothetical protein